MFLFFENWVYTYFFSMQPESYYFTQSLYDWIKKHWWRHVTTYDKGNFDSSMNIGILTTSTKFMKDSERFDQRVFNYCWNHSYFFIHTLFKLFVQEVRYIITRIFALIYNTFNLIVYKWTVSYHFCTVMFCCIFTFIFNV